MPMVFLSPSTQQANEYITGGNEEQYMNRIIDAMEPLLDMVGISYGRNDPNGTVIDSVDSSNEQAYDLHLALHSNASPPAYAGVFRGPIVFYHPESEEGRRGAQIVKNGLQQIYPNPQAVKTMASTNLYELRRTQAPTVFVEVAYHDNPDDANWITGNIQTIADSLAASVAQYLGVPYGEDGNNETGVVMLHDGTLNLRSSPDMNAPIIGSLQNEEEVQVLRRFPTWYQVRTPQGEGYVHASYIYFR